MFLATLISTADTYSAYIGICCNIFVLVENLKFHAQQLSARLAILINSKTHTQTHTHTYTQIQIEEATPKEVGPKRGLILVQLGRKSISIFRPRAIAARKMPKGAAKRSSCNVRTQTEVKQA